jgi:predicted HAD superfamily Cof-like phosphohydrolase
LQHKIEEVFLEIQRSNMSKLDADGKPIYREDGKVLKSELYFRPNIKQVLEV